MSYNGYEVLKLNDVELADFYEGDYKADLKINQYVILKNEKDEVIDKFRFVGNGYKKIAYPKLKDFKTLNWKQDCLCDLLSNSSIPIKIIAGVAGSGKTAICMRFGLYYLSKQTYSKIFLVRHNVSVGEKNGFLPGSKEEKIRPWLGFFEDNLDSVQYNVEEMISRGMLEVDSPEYMKGRDIKQSWIMIDEAEDLSEDQFKMLGERISTGSVICFIGDYEQTTQEKYKKSSGLIRAINKLAGNSNVGIIVFDDKLNDNVRSEASKVFSYLY